MKCWKKVNRICGICLAAVLFFCAGASAQAAPPETGTLKITLSEKEYQAEFAVFKVAEYVDGNYEINDAFAGGAANAVNLNHMKDVAEAEQCAQVLGEWAEKQQIAPTYQGRSSYGEWNLGKVPTGMYLVTQVHEEDSPLKVSTFLVGVPYWKVEKIGEEETKTLEYYVAAKPKCEVTDPPSPNPPTPEEPKPEPPTPEPPTPNPPTPEPPKPDSPDDVTTGDQAGARLYLYHFLLAVSAGVIFYLTVRSTERKHEMM